jgi:cation:H+ antiporter
VGAILAGATLVICLAGTRPANLADTLADRTGMGEIIAGALFVGASTSLPVGLEQLLAWGVDRIAATLAAKTAAIAERAAGLGLAGCRRTAAPATILA